jgi:hypothetical protein
VKVPPRLSTPTRKLPSAERKDAPTVVTKCMRLDGSPRAFVSERYDAHLFDGFADFIRLRHFGSSLSQCGNPVDDGSHGLTGAAVCDAASHNLSKSNRILDDLLLLHAVLYRRKLDLVRITAAKLSL